MTQPVSEVEHDQRSVAGYFDSFGPAPAWERLVEWPPDVFALASLVLDHTEGYRFVVAPPPGAKWPPFVGWNEQAQAAAAGWRWAVSPAHGELPALITSNWEVVTQLRDTPVASVRSGEARKLLAAS